MIFLPTASLLETFHLCPNGVSYILMLPKTPTFETVSQKYEGPHAFRCELYAQKVTCPEQH